MTRKPAEMSMPERIAASIAHHEARMEKALNAKDYSTMRDAQKVLADLRRMAS